VRPAPDALRDHDGLIERERHPLDVARFRARIDPRARSPSNITSIDTESRREIASRHSSDSDSEFVSGVAPPEFTATGGAGSEPREIKLHPTPREIGFSLEPVAAAPAIVGGSLRSLK
jgi:hypothetical protein